LLPEVDASTAPPDFLQQCSDYRDAGYRFLGLQTNCARVSYLFEAHGEVVCLEQSVDDGMVSSIALFFPLADFAERQMYRDCQIKALGNINLIPREA
jgi:hypothetical protein